MRIDTNINNSPGLIKLEQQKVGEQKFQDILKEAQKEQDDQKLKEACRQLESIFVHQMLSQMRNSIPSDGYLQPNHGEKIFQDMLDQEYAQKISQAGGIGIADMIYRQLTNK
ncbi:MAG: muramidase [Clostridia bacterium]|jgi:flagellar protein FlgJ|nr:muramidase [Clostridia bacterium]